MGFDLIYWKRGHFGFYPTDDPAGQKGHRNSGLSIAHSEGGKHHGQGGDKRKCDD